MATNKTVVVLAPNGRRQTVKVSSNTTIMQILEQVCKKQGYSVEEYDIKHHNKVLDTTTTILFSGLPNNAQLELTPATKAREESEITIALNLENGSRLLGTFNPGATLWEVASQLCESEPNLALNPVIIYMRNELFGEALKTTTLRSLGITGGRAMLRLIHRSPEELQEQPNVSTPLPSKPTKEKPYVRKLQRLEPEYTATAKSDDKSSEKGQIVQGVKQKTKTEAPKQQLTELLDKVKQEKKKLDTFPSESEGHVLNAPQSEPMEVDNSGKDTLVAGAVVADAEEEKVEEFVFLGERNAMAFSLETAESVPTSDLPDDFFELTIDDAKKILRDIKRKRHELENAQLMTSAMRNLQESKKQLGLLNRYKHAVIRIHFPDRTVLQGTFAPTETVKDIVNFVQQYLEDPKMDFHLYTAPPKNILNEENRLMEIGCVPGALLHFGTDTKLEEKSYLKKDVTDKFTTNSLASLAASKMRQKGKRNTVMNNDAEETEPSPSTSKEVEPCTSSVNVAYEDYPQRNPNVTSTEKVPKWFKPL